MNKFALCIFTYFACVFFVYSEDPKVSNKLGEIIGKTITVPYDTLPYRNVHEYLGIPFAQPPVGDRRFRKPEPMAYLDSKFYAQNHRAICPQVSDWANDAEQSEDCLFLNVYVPDRPADMPTGHAVMIWVYGGGFNLGASNYYDGALMAVSGNVIVVTINYRVGAFGFLSTGDDNAPGNFGLWDQRMAFQWVHDYIGDFGGDNEKVTIAGESAGAMSTIQHGLIPDNHGLFQRIIAQSGTLSSPALDIERDGMKETLALAYQLGCPTSMDELMPCLREKSVNEYLSAIKSIGVYFFPIVDGHLIKINPQHISKMAEDRNLDEVEFFRSLDILSGFNAYEGMDVLSFIMDHNQIETMQPSRDEMSESYLPRLMTLVFRKEFTEELLKVVEAQYTNWTNPYSYESIRLLITKLAGDPSFAVPAIEMARLHKKSSASGNFMYHFIPVPSVRALPTPSWLPGANHADDLRFVFGDVGYQGTDEENAWEIELATKMITYWTNFVKSGNPNFPVSTTPFWPEYETEIEEYLVLEKNMSQSSSRRFFYAEETNFWLEIFPDLVDMFQGKSSMCGEFTSAAANLNAALILPFVTAVTLVSMF